MLLGMLVVELAVVLVLAPGDGGVWAACISLTVAVSYALVYGLYRITLMMRRKTEREALWPLQACCLVASLVASAFVHIVLLGY